MGCNGLGRVFGGKGNGGGGGGGGGFSGGRQGNGKTGGTPPNGTGDNGRTGGPAAGPAVLAQAASVQSSGEAGDGILIADETGDAKSSTDAVAAARGAPWQPAWRSRMNANTCTGVR